MKIRNLALVTLATVALAAMSAPMQVSAAQPDEKGKTCRMEQQCHWENFKKVCVYVKVCR
jgi:hypothetical protein